MGGIIGKELGSGAGREFGRISEEHADNAREYLSNITSKNFAEDLGWFMTIVKELYEQV
jgi:hypothetical protein